MTVHVGQMSWNEYAERVQDDAVVFVPCGSLEQHGPHLPLATDALLSSAVCEGVAGEVAGLVLPALSYGYKSMPKSGGGAHFPGTTNLDATTLIAQVRDIIREQVRHGVRKLAFCVGHYENQWMVTEGIDLAMREVGHTGVRIMRFEYWDFTDQATIETVFPEGFPGFALEHAAIMETSLMMHHHPSLVRLDRLPDHPPAEFPHYDIWPPCQAWVPSSGALTSAKGSTAEKGLCLAEHYRRSIAEAVRREFRAPAGPSAT